MQMTCACLALSGTSTWGPEAVGAAGRCKLHKHATQFPNIGHCTAVRFQHLRGLKPSFYREDIPCASKAPFLTARSFLGRQQRRVKLPRGSAPRYYSTKISLRRNHRTPFFLGDIPTIDRNRPTDASARNKAATVPRIDGGKTYGRG
jgi:hypothetical protein